MAKDLFARVFLGRSRWSFDYYTNNFIEKLPFRLLAPAETVNVGLRHCRGYEELHHALRSASGRSSRNPELFPYLNYLNIQDNPDIQKSVDALRVHIGLDLLDEKAKHLRQFWRLRVSTATVVQVSADGDRFLSDVCIAGNSASPFPVVYRPYHGLFFDVQATLYRGDSDLNVEDCARLARDGLALIARYSRELATGFCREVSTIAFMPAVRGPGKSFSMRNFYVGGIFVSIADPIVVAEQFIHEYYHQCLWPWWLIEEPSDLPRSREIRSPITGQSRAIPVMIQATLIYLSLSNFYEFVLSSGEAGRQGPECVRAAEARASAIKSGTPLLIETLRSALSDAPDTAKLLETIVGEGF